jgi:hypothetical protein
MTITNALASVAVSDLSVSSDWYSTFLGRGNQPMPEVVEWQFERGGGLQIYTAPDRSGGSSCTLVVDDIDEIARSLRASGIDDDAAPARDDRVDTVMVKDPDGNSIAFAMPKDPSLAH